MPSKYFLELFSDGTIFSHRPLTKPMTMSSLNAYPRRLNPWKKLERPIFVVGSARSGTTFLGTQLGTLPNILHCPFELKDIWSGEGRVPMASPKTEDRTNPYMTGRDVWPGQQKALSRAFFKRMEAVDSEKSARPQCRLLNKNPHLANKIGLVYSLFPDAHFIWIHRPVLDVVASLKAVFVDVHNRQKAFHVWPDRTVSKLPRGLHMWRLGDKKFHEESRKFPGGDVSLLAEYWLEANQTISEGFREIPRGQTCRVDHSSLLACPVETFRKLCRFLDQPEAYAASMGSAVSDRNGQWRRRLSDSEIKAVQGFIATHRPAIDEIRGGSQIAGI